jgi:predicted GTPase
MATKRLINCATGEVTTVDLTPEEEAQRALDEQASAAVQAAREAADTERTAATTDLRDQYAAAITRLDQIRTQMATIAGATFANNAQRDAAIKQIAAGVDDEALILKRTLRLAKAALT